LKKKYTRDKAYISTKNEAALERLLAEYDLNYIKKDGYYRVEAENLAGLLEVLSVHKEYVTNIEIKKGTFNDVFLEITGKKIREDT